VTYTAKTVTESGRIGWLPWIGAAMSIAGLAIAMVPRFYLYGLPLPPDQYPWIGGLLIASAGLICLLAAIHKEAANFKSRGWGRWIAFGLIALGAWFAWLGITGGESRRLAKLRRADFLETMKQVMEVLESNPPLIGPSQSEPKKRVD
jgi:hypothetical protein